MKNKVLKTLRESRIMVVTRGLTDEQLIPYCRALIAGGIRMVELPFDQLAADKLEKTPRQIRLIRETFGDSLLVGAGTVLSVEEVDAAADAGACYVLAPSFDKNVVRRANERGICAFPGVMTPTEAQDAHLAGADMVKIFPTGILGVEYLKVLRVPLPHIGMIAMGGVTADNLVQFLQHCEAVGVGGGICDLKAIKAGNYAAITEKAKAYTDQVKPL